ncbi:hypothetical protein DKY63_31165 [Pseudomonas putida]|uniref:Uncharacterized protein n=1 Tax=Pseudomonas putida TaxID=303 RepID=A0A2Z4RSH0_PSEPU|nr:hypothetical protein DKY63_31165 [Pseudomonas putida]
MLIHGGILSNAMMSIEMKSPLFFMDPKASFRMVHKLKYCQLMAVKQGIGWVRLECVAGSKDRSLRQLLQGDVCSVGSSVGCRSLIPLR